MPELAPIYGHDTHLFLECVFCVGLRRGRSLCWGAPHTLADWGLSLTIARRLCHTHSSAQQSFASFEVGLHATPLSSICLFDACLPAILSLLQRRGCVQERMLKHQSSESYAIARFCCCFLACEFGTCSCGCLSMCATYRSASCNDRLSMPIQTTRVVHTTPIHHHHKGLRLPGRSPWSVPTGFVSQLTLALILTLLIDIWKWHRLVFLPRAHVYKSV